MNCFMMKRIRRIWAIYSLLLYLLLPQFVNAAENSSTDQDRAMERSAEMPGRPPRWIPFPVIASSPETGLMLGGMLFYFFPVTQPEQQASTVDLMAYGTTKGQYSFSLTPNIFLNNGLYRLNATLYDDFWRANYYPIGNDSPDLAEKYDSTTIGVKCTVERRIFETYLVDFIARYETVKMDVEAGGLLATGNVFGSTDGEYAGIGLALGYDSRDNTNAPAQGVLARYEYVNYNQGVGSDLDFSVQTADLRYYLKTVWLQDSVLAFAAQLRISNGDVPFRQLSTPDGTLILRGIEAGRYRDKDMLAVQSEWRFPIKAKFSGTVFAEAAQVAPTPSDFAVADFKTSLGVGLRYALNPEERFNIRADIAWVDDGIGAILNIREAF